MLSTPLIYLRIFKLFILLFFCTPFVDAQWINIDDSYSAKQLVKDIFLGNSCVEVDERSIEITGFHGGGFISYGYFEKGTSTFPFEHGILLTTGNLADAVGPNVQRQSFTNSNWDGDADLEEALNLASRSTFDATILEFDFISPQQHSISFDYIFASEQYIRSRSEGNCGYTDGFAFLIKEADSREDYTNIAVIPQTDIPVSVNTIFGIGGACPAVNPMYFGQFNYEQDPINFNGQTTVLTAKATITPGVKYHIKLVIADQGNGLYDSGVFLKAGSFNGELNLGDDLLVHQDTALCIGEHQLLDASTPHAVAYQWSKDGEIIPFATSSTYNVQSTGNYEVEVTLSTGCTISGAIRIEYFTDVELLSDHFDVCDDDFDGTLFIALEDYIAQLFQAPQANWDLSFHASLLDAQNAVQSLSTVSISPEEAEKTIYVRLAIGNCPAQVYPVVFTRKPLTPYQSLDTFQLCDEELLGYQDINLNVYMRYLSEEVTQTRFYLTSLDAQLQQNPVSANQRITTPQTFYVRMSDGVLCDNIAPISFALHASALSPLLVDQTICKGATTTLDAGEGYDSYLWSYENATTSTLTDVPVGTYTVRLGKNGCYYTQTVVVRASEDPVIRSIHIQGSTVTVVMEDSMTDYLYALDDQNFQASPVFTQVSLGNHVVYVKVRSGECAAVAKPFSLVQLSTFLSPNGDGINDTMDFSSLLYKEHPKFVVYDRFGFVVFEGSIANQFIWDGKRHNQPLPSGSYWVDVEWKETGSTEVRRYTTSVLLKHQ